MSETTISTRDQATMRRYDRLAAAATVTANAVLVALVVGAGVWVGLDGNTRFTLFDDAAISMSYARTIAAGEGAVWYPGAQLVEGITNPGWTALMTVVHLVGMSGTAASLAIVVVSLICIWSAASIGARLVGTVGLVPQFGSGHWTAIAAVVVNFPLVYWSVRGMEVGVVTLATLTATALTWSIVVGHSPSARRMALLGAVVVAAVVVRQDAAVVVAALVVWSLWRGGRSGRQVAAVLASAGLVTLSAVTLVRLEIYGELLPNTYHLKVDGIDLATRVERGLLVDVITAGPYVIAPLALVVVSWPWLRDIERQLIGCILTVAAALIAYSTYVGADAWEQFLIPNRYLTPATVLLALAGCSACVAAWRREGDDGTSETEGFRARWATVAAIIGATPAVAVLASLLADRAFVGAGGLAGTVDSMLVVPGVACIVAGFYVASRVRQGGSYSSVAVVVLFLVVTCARLPNLARDDGTRFAVLGDHLEAVTSTDAVIAAGGVGGLQYWSRRPVVDVLGKSDSTIARLDPVGERFIPGHDKFDSSYSVGRLRPDVVAQGLAAEEVLRFGYLPVRSKLGPMPEGIALNEEPVWFVRPDSTNVRWDLLEVID